MAAGWGRGFRSVASRAIMTIIVRGGQLVQQHLTGMGTGFNLVQRSMRAFSSQLATMTKALTSMIAVMIAFNLLVTLPEKIIMGIAGAIKFALDALNKFQQGVIGTQAIMATTIQFNEEAGKNFEIAGKAALQVNRMLLKEARETPATLEQLQQGFQSLVGAGGLKYVRNLHDAVKLNTLLVNSTLALTVGMDANRQIATEIRAIFQGTENAGSQLARLIGASSDKFKDMLENAKKNKDLLEVMTQILEGFAFARIEFQQSLEAIRTSIEDILNLFARQTIGPTAQILVKAFRDIEQFLEDSWETINKIQAVIGGFLAAAVVEILNYFKQLAKGQLPSIAETVRSIGVALYRGAMHVKNLASMAYPVWIIFKNLAIIIGKGLFQGLQSVMRVLRDWARVSYAIMLGPAGYKLLIQALKDANKPFDAQIDIATSIKTAIVEIGGALFQNQKIIDVNAATAEFEAKWRWEELNIERQLYDEHRAQNELLDKNLTLKKETAEVDKDALKKRADALKALQHFTDALADDAVNKIEKIGIDSERLWHEAQEKFAEYPDLFAIAIMSISERTQREIHKAGAEIMEKRTKDSVEAVAKGTRAALDIMGDTHREAGRKLKEVEDRMAGITEQYDRQIKSNRLLLRGIDRTLKLYKYQQEGLLPPGADAGLGGTLREQMVDAEGRFNALGKSIEEARILGDAWGYDTEINGKAIQATLEQLEDQYDETAEKIIAVTQAQRELQFTFMSSETAMKRILEVMTKSGKPFKNFKEMVLTIGFAFADTISAIFEGSQTIGQALKSMAGQFIVLIGQMLMSIAMATIAANMIGGIFAEIAGGSTAKALAALVIGAALVGLGRRLQGGGGGGGGVEGAGAAAGGGGGSATQASMAPQYVQQKDIAAQQGVSRGLQANTDAVNNLNGEVSRLSKERGDVLVSRTISQNPRIVTKTVSGVAAKSYHTSREMGGAILGESS